MTQGALQEETIGVASPTAALLLYQRNYQISQTDRLLNLVIAKMVPDRTIQREWTRNVRSAAKSKLPAKKAQNAAIDG